MLREIGGRRIGPGAPLFVIAEIGLNHGGSVARALTMVDQAADAGASAIKLQTIDADRLVAAHCPPPAHVSADSLAGFFRQFELNEDAHAALAGRARERGLAFIATPFCLEAVDMLERDPWRAIGQCAGIEQVRADPAGVDVAGMRRGRRLLHCGVHRAQPTAA